MHKLVLILSVILTFFSLLSCNRDAEVIDRNSQISFKLDSEDLREIDFMDVIVSTSDEILTHQEFDIPRGSEKIDLDIAMPIDAKSISVEAFDKEGKIIFTGKSPINALGSEVLLRLDPVTPFLKFRPIFDRIYQNDNVPLELEFRNVKNLFAVTFEVKFDEAQFDVAEVRSGNFWKNEVLIFSDYRNPAREHGQLSIGIARKGTQDFDGSERSGVVAVIVLHAKTAGNSELRVPKNGRLSAEQPNSEPIENFDQMLRYLEHAKISLSVEPSRTVDP